jgi:hypothetical protein
MLKQDADTRLIRLVAADETQDRTIVFPIEQDFDMETLEDYSFAYGVDFVGFDD